MTNFQTEQPHYGRFVRMPVHISDLDVMGQLYNARYVTLVEQACEKVMADIGLRYQDGKVTHPDLFAAVRELHINYRAPYRSTGEIVVHLWLDHIGNSSVRWGFRVLSPDSELVHAEGHRIVVKVDPRTGQAAGWTDKVRSAVEPLLRLPVEQPQ
jgi:acyl-CoA thioester hydrolase